jgi:hypothetical protein
LLDNTNIASLSGHGGCVYALALSADNKWLFSGSDDHAIKIWRIALLTSWSDSEHRHHTLLPDQSGANFELLAALPPEWLFWDDLRRVLQAWCTVWYHDALDCLKPIPRLMPWPCDLFRRLDLETLDRILVHFTFLSPTPCCSRLSCRCCCP